MLFIGIALMLLCAFFAWREYTLYLGRELSELAEFISFFKTMRERMKCYLEPPSAWIHNYSTPELLRVGFIGYIRDGADLCSAYTMCEGELCISDEARAVIRDMLSAQGGGYLEGELSAIDTAVDKLSLIEKRTREDHGNKSRAAGAVIAAVSIGIVILVI